MPLNGLKLELAQDVAIIGARMRTLIGIMSIYVDCKLRQQQLPVANFLFASWMFFSTSARGKRGCTLSGLKVIQFGYGRDITTAQDALNVLKDALKFGESVVVAVDGPAGPALKV